MSGAASEAKANGKEVAVDPAILAAIKRPGAPSAMPPVPSAPSGIEGRLGLLEGMRRIFGVLRHGVDFSLRGRAEHGDLYRVPYFGRSMVIVWSPDEIHRILKNEDNAWSTAMGWDIMMEGLDPRVGNTGTLMTLDFDEHRAARKLVQPAFTLRAIEGYLAIAERGFSHVVSRWIERGRVDFKAEVRTLLAQVAGEIFTGIRDPEKVAIVDRALSDFWHGLLALRRNPLLSPKFRRAQRGFVTLLRTFLALVPERRKNGGDDLFSRLCQVDGEAKSDLDDEALVRIFVSIMFGAFDTTSAAVTSMAYLLAKHPEWQERLRDESRRVPALDAANMKSVRELDWVWKETLRLLPVTAWVPRRALRDVEVSGRRLPAGALVAVMASSVGRHPKWWTDPSTFDPMRFSPERAEDKKHPGIFVPFGAGPHACVGMQLANMEAKLLWHKLLTGCRFRLSPDYEARHTHTPMGTVSGKVSLSLERL